MNNKRTPEAVSVVARLIIIIIIISFSYFTRCSRRLYLCLKGLLVDRKHGVILPSTLRRLGRKPFTYLRPKNFLSRFNAFCSALF